MPDDDQMFAITVPLTEPVARQVVAAAALVGEHPQDFVEDAVLNRLQAVDNILHDDTEHVELPPDFDVEAWRQRYQAIRRPEVYEPEDDDG